MNELGDFLGALLSSVARARKIADEEALAIAEEYDKVPLMRGMAAPRFRLPSVSVDIPVLFGDIAGGEEAEPESPHKVLEIAEKTALKELAEAGAELTTNDKNDLKAHLKKAIIDVPADTPRLGYRSEMRLAVHKAMVGWGKKKPQVGNTPPQLRNLGNLNLADLANKASDAASKKAIRKEGAGSRVLMTGATKDVKEHGGPERVATLHIKINEEGLEWVSETDAQGNERRHLTPE